MATRSTAAATPPEAYPADVDPRERLLAQVLETLTACIPASVAMAFRVDAGGRLDRPQARAAQCGPARAGYGTPLMAAFRRDGRVIAGVALLRESGLAPFDAQAARLLAGLQPLIEDALCVCEAPPTPPEGPDPLTVAGLTTRETQVACLVTQGVSNACIAATLGMSEATVKTHLTRIYLKVGVRSRTELAVVIGRRS